MLRKIDFSNMWPGMPDVWKEMNRAFGSMSNDFMDLFADQVPFTGWKQTEAGYELRLEIPGYSKEELKMEVDQETETLMIEGKKKDQNDRYASQSTFRLSRTLPSGSKIDTLNASVQNGVCLLSIQAAEKKESKPRTIPVTIS
jgi:HSP20 family molecular chaperone IbpA